jgi:hypothetical protein
LSFLQPKGKIEQWSIEFDATTFT